MNKKSIMDYLLLGYPKVEVDLVTQKKTEKMEFVCPVDFLLSRHIQEHFMGRSILLAKAEIVHGEHLCRLWVELNVA